MFFKTFVTPLFITLFETPWDIKSLKHQGTLVVCNDDLSYIPPALDQATDQMLLVQVSMPSVRVSMPSVRVPTPFVRVSTPLNRVSTPLVSTSTPLVSASTNFIAHFIAHEYIVK